MISLDKLTLQEVEVIGRCLEAASRGPYFPDWEFETLFGLTRPEVARVAAFWPQNLKLPSTETAVVNAIVNLLGYPHGWEEQMSTLVADRNEMEKILEKLRNV